MEISAIYPNSLLSQEFVKRLLTHSIEALRIFARNWLKEELDLKLILLDDNRLSFGPDASILLIFASEEIEIDCFAWASNPKKWSIEIYSKKLKEEAKILGSSKHVLTKYNLQMAFAISKNLYPILKLCASEKNPCNSSSREKLINLGAEFDPAYHENNKPC